MPKSSLPIVMLLLVVGLFALWRNQTETIIRDTPMIDAVTVGAGGSLTISGAMAQDCTAALQAEVTSFPNNLDIQLYRERSSLAACGMQAASLNTSLDLETDSIPLYIIINGEIWAMTLAQPGGSYEAQSLFPANIDGASIAPFDAESGTFQLSIRGSQAVGCELPELFTLRYTDERIQINVYNAIGADVACPDMLVEVDETISLPATELPADTLFAVNTIFVEEMETQNVSDSDKVLTNILRVDATVKQAQISLEVEGEHPDGCDLPVHVEQSRTGNTVNVEVYRQVPADMICPMILRPYQGTIQLDGDFDAGSYTISVNSHSQTLDI